MTSDRPREVLVLSGGVASILGVEMFAMSLQMVLDSKFDDWDVGRGVSERWARANGMDPCPMISFSHREPTFGVFGPVKGRSDRVPARLADAMQTMETLLAAAGRRVTQWESVEMMTMATLEKRARIAAFPQLVDAGAFAKMCGVSRSRIHALSAASRRDRENGRWHRFPPPIVPGYWLLTSAETFARGRRSTPGPAPRTRRDRFMDQLMAKDKAQREGLPVPDVDYTLLNMPMTEALQELGYTAEEARRLVGDGDRPTTEPGS